MFLQISAVVKRLSEWDSELERHAHPWFMPSGLFFWWAWRPSIAIASLAILLGLGVGSLTLVDRLRGTVWCVYIGAPISELRPCVDEWITFRDPDLSVALAFLWFGAGVFPHTARP